MAFLELLVVGHARLDVEQQQRRGVAGRAGTPVGQAEAVGVAGLYEVGVVA